MTGSNDQVPSPGQIEANRPHLAAIALTQTIAAGDSLPVVEVPIKLGFSEVCHLQTGFRLSVYAAARAQAPNHAFVAAFGDPWLLAASIGGSLLYNAHQQEQARAAAAIQWRAADQGIVYLTNQRICLQGHVQWRDIPFSSLRSLDPYSDGIVLYQEGLSPTKLATSWLEYFYVMLSWLGFNRQIPVDRDSTGPI